MDERALPSVSEGHVLELVRGAGHQDHQGLGGREQFGLAMVEDATVEALQGHISDARGGM